MATDWVKMRTDLYRDPKVCVMAEILTRPNGLLASHVSRFLSRDMAVTRHMMRHAVVGALSTVWGVARVRGKRDGSDLVIRGVTIDVINDISDLPGFGEAMAEVGWVTVTEEGIVFPRFYEEFNTDPESSKKSADAERQRLHRQKKRDMSRDALRDSHSDMSHDSNVTVTQKCHSREEKRREEKEDSKTPPPPATGEGPKTDDATAPPVSPPPPPTKRKVASADPNFDPLAVDLPFKSDRFREAWEAWVRHRVKIKKRMSLDAVRLFFHQFVSWGEERTIAAIEHSIMQGYQGVFENTNRQGGAANPSGYKSKVDRDNEIWIENAQSCLE